MPKRVSKVALLQQAAKAFKAADYLLCIRHTEQVLKALPSNTQALQLKGIAHSRLKDYAQAIQVFDQAIALSPSVDALYINKAKTQNFQGKLSAAIQTCSDGLQKKPTARLFFARAQYYFESQQFVEACSDCKQSLHLKTDQQAAWSCLAKSCVELQSYRGAASAWLQAYKLTPDRTDILLQVVQAQLLAGLFWRAERLLNTAAIQQPESTDVWLCRARLYREQATFDKAIYAAQHALKIDPKNTDAQWQLAQLYLLTENFEQGWPLFNAQWNRPNILVSQTPQQDSQWWQQHEPIENLTLWAEQGLGDQIMFMSCLNEVDTSQVHLQCEQRLLPLVKRSFLHLASCTSKYKQPTLSQDVRHAPLSQLAQKVHPSSAGFNNRGAYLVADGKKQKIWQQKLSTLAARPNVGLSWHSGNIENNAAVRSIALHQFQPLFELPINLINLQYGDVEQEIAATSDRVVDWPNSDNFYDIDGLAAKINALDLVISIDNVTLHLAGALGKSCFALLPYNADWRWFTRNNKSLWYGDNVRFYRQDKQRQWAPVIDSVVQATVEVLDLN